MVSLAIVSAAPRSASSSARSAVSSASAASFSPRSPSTASSSFSTLRPSSRSSSFRWLTGVRRLTERRHADDVDVELVAAMRSPSERMWPPPAVAMVPVGAGRNERPDGGLEAAWRVRGFQVTSVPARRSTEIAQADMQFGRWFYVHDKMGLKRVAVSHQ
jgi:hypothetical protein